MKRAALYARFSGDQQNPLSADDQLALCREWCEKNGYVVAAEYADRAISGASVLNRPAVRELMSAIPTGRFDVVVIEALDRISRDQEDVAAIFKRLRFADIQLLSVAEGEIGPLHIGLKGTMNAMFLDDLSKKVKRGLDAITLKGKFAAGIPYGYRRIPGKPGEIEIDQEKAEIVRRIFREYAGGLGAWKIALILNAEGVPAPRGGKWRDGAILHSRAERASGGILQNEVYKGVLAYGHTKSIKNPSTGKNTLRPRRDDEVKRVPVPHLAIVTADLWDSVQAMHETKRAEHKRHRGPQRLLSGLMKCSECGGSIVSTGTKKEGKKTYTYVRCLNARNGLGCDHRKMHLVDRLEGDVLEALKKRLRDKDAIAASIQAYHAEAERIAKSSSGERAATAKRQAELQIKLDRLVDQVADGAMSGASVNRKIAELEAEIATLAQRLAELPTASNVVALHPRAKDHYLKIVDELDGGEKTTELLRKIVDRVNVKPSGEFEIVGHLNALLGGNNNDRVAAGIVNPTRAHFKIQSAAV